jgi:predicted nucleotidyltransferase
MMGDVEDAEYDRLVERIVQLTEGEPRIEALLIYGSRAGGSADRFSDLDIGIVTADDGFEWVVADARGLIGKLGTPLFLDDFGEPRELHAILAEGADLELIIDRASDLVLAGPHRMLFDRGGVVARAEAKGRPAPEPVDTDDLRRRILGYWHDVEHLVTALGRGNTWWAFGQLDELRRMYLNLARIDAGQAPEDEAYWKLDEALTPERLAGLRETFAPPEIGPMRGAALVLLDRYRELARTLGERHGVPYPDELDRLISDRLRALEGR